AANDGIGFAPPHDADVPQEVIDEVQAVFEMLKSGELDTGVDGLTGELLEPVTEESGS
ncbi:MAG: BMP family ABC transporter substrate-binding protein, partial [Phototrophicales bacterium]